jgi:hypothetical protein
MAVPEYVSSRIRRPAPAGCSIVEGSTPVISFGDFTSARVATLGLNPSSAEFWDKDQRLLAGDQRRLSTFESLNVHGLASVPQEKVEEVYRDCANYFRKQPYWRWFRPLDDFNKQFGASYKDGSASHLDLVQWATWPKWAALDAKVRRKMLDDDALFLRQQLTNEKIEVLLINGGGAWAEFSERFKRELTFRELEPLTGHSHQTCSLYAGKFKAVTVHAWSANLQSSMGVRATFAEEVCGRLLAAKV